MAKYEYTVDEDYPEGAVSFSSFLLSALWDGKDIANDAAAAYYDDADEDCFPLEITIFKDGKNLGKFEVYLEFSPEFSAVRIDEVVK